MEDLTSVKTAAEFSTSIVDGHNTMLPTIAAIILKDWGSADLADAVTIVHATLIFFVHSASDALPPYAVDIGLKWCHFAGDKLWDSLSKLPAGVVRVLLWEIWKDFCTLKYGPHGWTVVYTPEGYQAQTSRLAQLSSNSARTGNLAGTSGMQAGNLGGGIADRGEGSVAQTVQSGEVMLTANVRTVIPAENSGKASSNLEVDSRDASKESSLKESKAWISAIKRQTRLSMGAKTVWKEQQQRRLETRQKRTRHRSCRTCKRVH